MTEQLDSDDVTVGRCHEAIFEVNDVEGSPFRFRSRHLDGKRAPKVVLCNDARVRPGVPCLVRVTALRKPKAKAQGAIEVEFVQDLAFKLEGVYVDPSVARKLQVLLETGQNILLDGPQGCGKTLLARTIAAQLGFEFVLFNCGAVIEATDFLATIQVRASASGAPVTDFVKTEILEALETALANPHRRYLVFLDELNRCQESARNALMPALDATRRVYHPIDNRFLPIADNVQFIAAVNRGHSFSGTFGIDAAQLDRFAPLQMTYPPPVEEVNILTRRHPRLARAVVERIVDLAHAVRSAPDLQASLSVRATDEACTYLEHPLFADDPHRAMGEILRSSFCGRFTGRHDDLASDAGAVWAIVDARLRAVGLPHRTPSRPTVHGPAAAVFQRPCALPQPLVPRRRPCQGARVAAPRRGHHRHLRSPPP